MQCVCVRVCVRAPFIWLTLYHVHDVTCQMLKTTDECQSSLDPKQVSIFRDNYNYLGCRLSFETFAPISRPPKVALVI